MQLWADTNLDARALPLCSLGAAITGVEMAAASTFSTHQWALALDLRMPERRALLGCLDRFCIESAPVKASTFGPG